MIHKETTPCQKEESKRQKFTDLTCMYIPNFPSQGTEVVLEGPGKVYQPKGIDEYKQVDSNEHRMATAHVNSMWL